MEQKSECCTQHFKGKRPLNPIHFADLFIDATDPSKKGLDKFEEIIDLAFWIKYIVNVHILAV